MNTKEIIQIKFSEKNKNPEKIAKMFNNIAPRYDLMNDVMSLFTHKNTRKFGLTLVKSKRKIKILDLATGTGDFAFLHAKNSKIPFSEIIGLDFSSGMLTIGKRRSRKLGLSKYIKFIEGDIMKMPFKNDQFDLLTIGYGIRNVVDIPAGLKEIYRVTKPGGSFIVVEATPPLNKVWRFLIKFYFEKLVTQASKFLSSAPVGYDYFIRSVSAFYNAIEFSQKLREAGFKNVRWFPQVMGSVTIFQGVKL
jgi:demethylmenaquinone methyltransferase/2-methoxy-6-polyprenyl-1,4-benzoquinol methylase